MILCFFNLLYNFSVRKVRLRNMKVSVALCTYYGERYIKEQLDSILNQTILPDEIVIFDDNSTDSTYEIIKKINFKPQIQIKLN